MKTLNLLVILFGVICFVSVARPQENDAAKNEVKKLQGVWQVVKFIDHSERAAPPEELKEFTFEFKNDKVTQQKGKDGPGRPGTFTIDVSRKPTWMDINFGKISEGIYKLDGDELSLCFVGGMRGDKVTPRPTEFKASKNPPHTLLVLKRVKK
jgi:uncharacterized protein (TIGR03067 family)